MLPPRRGFKRENGAHRGARARGWPAGPALPALPAQATPGRPDPTRAQPVPGARMRARNPNRGPRAPRFLVVGALWTVYVVWIGVAIGGRGGVGHLSVIAAFGFCAAGVTVDLLSSRHGN